MHELKIEVTDKLGNLHKNTLILVELYRIKIVLLDTFRGMAYSVPGRDKYRGVEIGGYLFSAMSL